MIAKMFGKVQVLQGIAGEKKENWQALEKILLTIDGGILGVSITVLTNHDGTFIHPILIKISWLSFALSLIFLALSYACSEYFHETLLRRVGAQPDTFSEEVLNSLKSKGAIVGMYITNYGALGFTILGLIMLVFFGVFNIV